MRPFLRIIDCRWPGIDPSIKRTVLIAGGIIELSRHFACAWNAWSFDVHTDRAYCCATPTGVLALGVGCREVGFWWGLWSPIRGITIHAGFIGILSIRLDAYQRQMALAALERASINNTDGVSHV